MAIGSCELPNRSVTFGTVERNGGTMEQNAAPRALSFHECLATLASWHDALRSENQQLVTLLKKAGVPLPQPGPQERIEALLKNDGSPGPVTNSISAGATAHEEMTGHEVRRISEVHEEEASHEASADDRARVEVSASPDSFQTVPLTQAHVVEDAIWQSPPGLNRTASGSSDVPSSIMPHTAIGQSDSSRSLDSSSVAGVRDTRESLASILEHPVVDTLQKGSSSSMLSGMRKREEQPRASLASLNFHANTPTSSLRELGGNAKPRNPRTSSNNRMSMVGGDMNLLRRHSAISQSAGGSSIPTSALARKINSKPPGRGNIAHSNHHIMFQMRPVFRITFAAAQKKNLRKNQTDAEIGAKLSGRDFDGTGTGSLRHSNSELLEVSKYSLDPNSRFQGYLVAAMQAVMVFDSAFISYLVAWEPRHNPVSTAISICLLMFWFAVMALNFFTGFYRKGELELRLRAIAWNYVKTWFFWDASINCMALTGFIMEMSAERSDQSFDPTNLMSLGRMMRVVELLRLPAVFARLKVLSQASSEESTSLVPAVARIIVTVLWLNHIISCVWFVIGRASSQSHMASSWLETPLFVDSSTDTFLDADPLYQYSTSLHWAMTQMTPGSMEVFPRNSIERLFNILVLNMGLLVSSLLISQLSAKMVQTKTANQKQKKQRQQLHQFLVENNISRSLMARIEQQVSERVGVSKKLMEKDVPSLSLLSTKLRKDLRYDAYGKYIKEHLLFRTWEFIDQSVTKNICDHAVEILSISPGDEVFTPFSIPDRMFFVLEGTLRHGYLDQKDESDAEESHSSFGDSRLTVQSETVDPDDDDDQSSHYCTQTVEAGTWISEVALWTEWTYNGTLEAVTPCELLVIDVPKLLDLLQKSLSLAEINFHYGEAFQKTLAQFGGSGNESADAIMSGSGHLGQMELLTNHASVLMMMEKAQRMQVMRPLLNQHKRQNIKNHLSFNNRSQRMAELEEELEAGKCILTLGKDGDVRRTVPLVVLKVERPGGLYLTQIAVAKGREDLAPAVAFPGRKVKEGEQPFQVAQNILLGDLAEISPFVDMSSHVEMQVSEVKSEAFGLYTQYLKSCFYGSWLETLQERNSENAGETEDYDEHPSQGGTFGAKCTSSPSGIFSGIFESLDDNMRFIQTSAKRVLYAWLTQDQFDQLKTPKGEEELGRWLETCTLPTCAGGAPRRCAMKPPRDTVQNRESTLYATSSGATAPQANVVTNVEPIGQPGQVNRDDESLDKPLKKSTSFPQLKSSPSFQKGKAKKANKEEEVLT